MGTGLEIAAFGALVAGAAGTAYSAIEQKKQAGALRDAQKDKQKLEIAMQNEQAARDKRSQIREARIQRAVVQNTAASTGQTGGSAAITGGQAATQQAGINIGNINTSMSNANIMGKANQNIADASSATPSIMSSLAGSLGGTLMQMGVQQGTKSIFKDEK